MLHEELSGSIWPGILEKDRLSWVGMNPVRYIQKLVRI